MRKKSSPREARQSQPSGEAPSKETGFAGAYVEFAKTLRTWFVAYGIGAPVLVLNQDKLRDALKASPEARTIAWCFLAGVGLQILAAFTYKIAMWYLYMGELSPAFCKSRRHRAADWISTALWLELLFDLGTVALFAWATVRVVQIFTQ